MNKIYLQLKILKMIPELCSIFWGNTNININIFINNSRIEIKSSSSAIFDGFISILKIFSRNYRH